MQVTWPGGMRGDEEAEQPGGLVEQTFRSQIRNVCRYHATTLVQYVATTLVQEQQKRHHAIDMAQILRGAT